MVTTAIFAPIKSRQLLSASGDPIYDVCNPPPVTLLSREESNDATNTAADPNKRHSDLISETSVKKPEESPAYLARCQHPGGNIIITADYTGSIKVFRQDCAYQKRRHDWETGSTFSKKMLGRSGSIMTRHSGGSRRNSVSQNTFIPPPNASDHILSWRNSVNNVNLESGSGIYPPRSERSVSPAKASPIVTKGHSQTAPVGRTPNQPANRSRQSPRSTTTSSLRTNSPPTSIRKSAAGGTKLPTPGFSLYSAKDDSGLSIDSNGRSYNFWNMQSWKNLGPKGEGGGDGLRPPTERLGSYVSKLSSEEGTSESGTVDESDGEALSCKKCGGKDFRAKKASVGGKGQRLVCTRCGTPVE